MQQKIALARALLHEPPQVFLHRFRRDTGKRHVGRAAIVPGREREAEDT